MARKPKTKEGVRRADRLRGREVAWRLARELKFYRWVESKIGATPAARLKWFLGEFLYADLAKGTDEQWLEWAYLLKAFSAWGTGTWLFRPDPGTQDAPRGRHALKPRETFEALFRHRALLRRAGIIDDATKTTHTWGREQDRDRITSCQLWVLEILEDLARGVPRAIPIGSITFICWIRPEESWLLGGPRIPRHFAAPLRDRVLLAAIDQLEAVGSDRLRLCPFQEPGAGVVCGRLFLGSSGRSFCSKKHAAKARYLRWKARGYPRGTRSKGGEPASG